MAQVQMNDASFQANLDAWINEAIDMLVDQFGPAAQYSVNWFPKPRIALNKELGGALQTIVIEFIVERDPYDKDRAAYVYNAVYIGGVRRVIETRADKATRTASKRVPHPVAKRGRPAKTPAPTIDDAPEGTE